MRHRHQKRHALTGFIVGAISGLAGTVVMTQFQNLWNKVSEEMRAAKATEKANGAHKKEKEDSTMKAAGKISRAIGRPLSPEERKKAGPWVHYAFGTSVGAVFGAAAEMRPETVRRINPIFAGAAYGATVFVAAHEIVVPALKLSSNPLEEPVPEQISEFVSHLIYGIGTALVYDGIKRLER